MFSLLYKVNLPSQALFVLCYFTCHLGAHIGYTIFDLKSVTTQLRKQYLRYNNATVSIENNCLSIFDKFSFCTHNVANFYYKTDRDIEPNGTFTQICGEKNYVKIKHCCYFAENCMQNLNSVNKV